MNLPYLLNYDFFLIKGNVAFVAVNFYEIMIHLVYGPPGAD